MLAGLLLLLAACGDDTPDFPNGVPDDATAINPDVSGPVSTPTSIADVFARLLQDGIDAGTRGDYQAAIVSYNQAMEIAKNRNDLAGQSNLHRQLGIAYYMQRQTDQALENYERAITIAQEIHNSVLEGNALRNSGIIYFDQGDYAKAIEYYDLALVAASRPDAREQDPVLAADVLFSLGKAYHLNGDLNLAQQNYEVAASIYSQLGDQAQHGSVLRNIGIIYDAQDYNEAALTYYQQALDIARQIGDIAFEQEMLGRIEALPSE